MALAQYDEAIQKDRSLKTADDVWAWLRDQGEILPEKKKTWKTYLSAGRRASGRSKNHPRAGLESRNVVPWDRA